MNRRQRRKKLGITKNDARDNKGVVLYGSDRLVDSTPAADLPEGSYGFGILDEGHCIEIARNIHIRQDFCLPRRIVEDMEKHVREASLFGMNRIGEVTPDMEQVEKMRPWLPDGHPCGHPNCLNHVTHPCEICGRIGGKSA